MGKKIFWIILLGILTCLIVIVVPIKKTINETVNGIQCCKENAEYSENVSVSIKGIYKQYLMKNDIFEGTIEIIGTKQNFDEHVFFLEFADGYAMLNYFEIENEKSVFKSWGRIRTKPLFKQFVIYICEPDNSSSNISSEENDIFISAPANDKEQAIEIEKELFR